MPDRETDKAWSRLDAVDMAQCKRFLPARPFLAGRRSLQPVRDPV
jgi:hypothetical protein